MPAPAYKDFPIPVTVRIHDADDKGSTLVEVRGEDITGKTWVVDRTLERRWGVVDLTHLMATFFSNAGSRGLALIDPSPPEEVTKPAKPKAPPPPPPSK